MDNVVQLGNTVTISQLMRQTADEWDRFENEDTDTPPEFVFIRINEDGSHYKDWSVSQYYYTMGILSHISTELSASLINDDE